VDDRSDLIAKKTTSFECGFIKIHCIWLARAKRGGDSIDRPKPSQGQSFVLNYYVEAISAGLFKTSLRVIRNAINSISATFYLILSFGKIRGLINSVFWILTEAKMTNER